MIWVKLFICIFSAVSAEFFWLLLIAWNNLHTHNAHWHQENFCGVLDQARFVYNCAGYLIISATDNCCDITGKGFDVFWRVLWGCFGGVFDAVLNFGAFDCRSLHFFLHSFILKSHSFLNILYNYCDLSHALGF